MIKKAENLKPCPFCGNNEIYYQQYDTEAGKRWRILCGHCMAQINTGTAQSMRALNSVWNKRIGDNNEN